MAVGSLETPRQSYWRTLLRIIWSRPPGLSSRDIVSDEEETIYLEADIDGRLIKGVQFATPEDDDDLIENTKDIPGQAHATLPVDAKDLANEPGEIRPVQLAAIDTNEDNIVVEAVPEIDCDFGEEPSIELPSYY